MILWQGVNRKLGFQIPYTQKPFQLQLPYIALRKEKGEDELIIIIVTASN